MSAIKVGKIAKDYQNKYPHFDQGKTLGRDMAASLKSGEGNYQDGTGFTLKIDSKTREKVQKWFDSNVSGELTADDLYKFAASDLTSSFNQGDDWDYSGNEELLRDLASGRLGVAVTAEAAGRAIAFVEGEALDTDTDEDHFEGKITADALKASALMDYSEAGKRYDDGQADESTAKGLISMKGFFQDKEHLKVLESYVAQLAEGQSKDELAKFVNSLGGQVPSNAA